MKFLASSFLAAVAAIAPFQAGASLLGDSVNLAAYHAFGTPISGSCLTLQATRAIGAGPELTLADTVSGGCSGAIGIDIDGSTGLLTLFAINGFAVGAGNYEFGTVTISGFDDAISGLSLVADNGLFTSADPFGTGAIVPSPVLAFTASSLQIDFSAPGVEFVLRDGGSMSFQITQATVPEPGTLALVAAAVLAAGAATRRRSGAARGASLDT